MVIHLETISSCLIIVHPDFPESVNPDIDILYRLGLVGFSTVSRVNRVRIRVSVRF